jgi:Flp pilus assembly protein TadD
VAGSPLAGRPLVSFSFALNYAADGLNVRGYRIVNVALHVACALLLFAIVARVPQEARTFEVRDLAFASALLWMVHPLNTEAVDYVSQRTELMMALFFLLTLYFGGSASPDHPLGGTRPTHPSRDARPTLLSASVICCGLGMACKETMAVAPIIVLLYDRTFVFGSFAAAWRARWRGYAALATTWILLAALLWSSPRGNSAGFAGASITPWSYLLDQSVMIVRYVRLAFWPRDLVLDYGSPAQVTFADVAPYAIVVGALLVATIVAVGRNTRIGFLGAWFFLTLAPTSSVIPISTEVGAERRMYLPLMAMVVVVIVSVPWCLGSLVRRFGGSKVRGFDGSSEQRSRANRRTREPSNQRTAEPTHQGTQALRNAWLLGSIPIAVLLAIGTMQRNSDYLSGSTLWQGVVDRWPGNPRAERNLAAELKLAGRRDEEIRHLREAAKGIPEVRNVLGVELMSMNRTEDAVSELQQYVHDYPRDADGWSNLGSALAAAGKPAEATRAFQRAVDVDPDNGLSQRNLALHLLDQNDFTGAVTHAREAIRRTPSDPDAHNLLGLALAGDGQIDDAIAEFRTSLQLRPENNDASGYLDRALKAARR